MSKEEAGGKNPDFQLKPNAPEAAPVAAEKKPSKAAVMAPGLEQYALTPRKEPDKNMVVQPGAANEDFSIQPPDNLQLQKPQLGTTIDQYGQPMGPHALIKDTGEDDVVDMSDYRLTREPNEGVVLIRDKETLLAEVARKDAENLTILEIQNRIIQLQQLEEARAAAEQEKTWRKSAEVTRLTPGQMRSFKERQANGGGIQLPSDDEYQTIIRAAEARRLKVAAAAEEIRNSLNPPELRLVPDPADTDGKESQSSAKLLKKGVSVSVNLDALATDDQLANTLQEYRAAREPQQVQNYKANVLAHLDDDPAAVIRKYGLEDYVKPEDIRAEGRAHGIDPQKAERLFDEMRIYHMTDDLFGEVQKKVEVEISKHSADSLSLYEGTRTAVHKYAESVKAADANAETVRILRGFKLQFDTALTEMRKQLAGELKKQSDPELFLRTKAAATLIAQENIRKILPNITPEQFLAVMSVQESYDTARNRLRGQIHEWYRKKYVKEEQIEQKKQSLESPMMINIKREDIVSPAELDALLAEYNRNPTAALEQELAGYTSHTDNREKAIQYFGLSGLIKPDDIKTDSPYEIREAVDNDRTIFFQNAIRLKHIVHDRLNQKVDAIVKAELGSSPSTSIDAYTKLQGFIAEKNPDATADDKRLLQEYYMGFGEMVNQEIRKQSLIFKDQERVFIDIGKHKATKIPARVVLSTARKVAAERFVRANQAQLPEGMTPEQFLAGMSVADTYRFSEDKLKEEVFEWYRKNKPRQNKDYDEGKESMPRRRIPVPFLRRGQAPSQPTPPETPPAPQPPTNPGNLPDNLPPGGTPPPEPPPVPPSGGGAAAGGAPSPDAQPDDDVDDDSVIVDAHILSADEPLFDLPEGLPINVIHIPDVHSDYLISDEEFSTELDKKRREDQEDIKEELESKAPSTILFEYRLEGKFTEDDVTNQNPKLIDAIHIQNIILERLSNKDLIQGLIELAEKQNPKFGEAVNIEFGKPDAFIQIYTSFLLDLKDFKESSEYQDATDKSLALQDERMRLALEYYNLNLSDLSSDMTPERLLAVFSFYETLSELNNQIFDELFAKSQGEEPQIPKPPSLPPQPPAPPHTGGEPPGAQPAEPARPPDFEAFKEAPTRREKRNIRQNIGKWLRNTINREPPISFEQSNGLLITNPNVTRVNTRGFINPDLFIDRLRLTDSAYRDRIKKNEIELRDLSEVVNKWGLQDIISEDLIEKDAEGVRESEQLIDAIIIRSMAAELFNEKTNKQAIDSQLREFIPKKTFEQYAAHKIVVFELLPEFRREWADRLSELSKSLPFVTVKERDQVIIKARKEAAQKLFNEHLTEMPQNSSPEKLLAALSLRETYVQIQDELFSDLYGMYRWLLPPDDDDEANNPPGHPRYPSGGGSGGSGSGGSNTGPGDSSPPNNGPSGGPAPDSNPSPGGAQAATYAEASDVEDQVAAVLAGIQMESSSQSSLDEIQKRLERRAAGKN